MKKDLDQFYTNESIARECIESLEQMLGDLSSWSSIVEPSAGSGSFLKLLPDHAIGLDLDPRDPKISQADYLTWTPQGNLGRCLVVGNPPFGKNSTLAIKFFNRSAIFADTIAFILPRTFRKSSVINRLSMQFHLVHDRVLPIDSFHTPNGADRSVPTCFQIWQRREIDRGTIIRGPENHVDWAWMKTSTGATHAIRRVGGLAGKLIPLHHASPASHLFIKSNVEDLDARWQLVWDKCWREEIELNAKWDVAGNPSLTKEEIVFYYDSIKNRITNFP